MNSRCLAGTPATFSTERPNHAGNGRAVRGVEDVDVFGAGRVEPRFESRSVDQAQHGPPKDVFRLVVRIGQHSDLGAVERHVEPQRQDAFDPRFADPLTGDDGDALTVADGVGDVDLVFVQLHAQDLVGEQGGVVAVPLPERADVVDGEPGGVEQGWIEHWLHLLRGVVENPTKSVGFSVRRFVGDQTGVFGLFCGRGWDFPGQGVGQGKRVDLDVHLGTRFLASAIFSANSGSMRAHSYGWPDHMRSPHSLNRATACPT